MKLDIFFHRHKIFTINELEDFFSEKNPALSRDQYIKRGTSTLRNLLAYHQKKGHIFRIRRGLYYSIPKGTPPNECSIDSFLVTSKMAEDAVLGYRTALDFFGKLHSISDEFIYISKKRETKPFVFKDIVYHGVSIPRALQKVNQTHFGVLSENRSGHHILVTSLERTFVDVLARPHLCGSWEQIWRSLETIEYLNLDQVLYYVHLLKNATIAARVGFFLDIHHDQWMIPESYLSKFKKYILRQPLYLDRNFQRKQKLIGKWNLIVPLELINREWEEPHENI